MSLSKSALFVIFSVVMNSSCGIAAADDLKKDSSEPGTSRPDSPQLVAPQLVAPADEATLTSDQLAFKWLLDSCRDRISVQICADSQCATPQQSFTSDSCTGALPDKTLSPGTYYWRAARLEGERLISSWSATRRFLIAAQPAPITADLYGVHALGERDVWTVGAAGTIAHYDGIWSVEKSGTASDLRAVWAASGGQAWAVGAAGTILRRNGSQWLATPSSTREDLYGVWGASIDNAWAVGNAGLILHWDGTRWSVAHDRMAGIFRAIWGTAANDVWVVGGGKESDGDYASLILHWDGTRWNESYVCNPEGTRSASGGWLAVLNDVYGVVGGSVWTAGQCQSGASFTPYGYVAQNAGAAGFSDTPGFGFGMPLGKYRPLSSIFSTSNSDVWIASSSENVSGSNTPTMMHFDGTNWTASTQNITVGINDLGGTTAKDIWAVGQGGKRLHYDGTMWTAAP